MRHAMGVTVFFGMLGVTFFGLFLTPVFYLLLRTLEKSITRTELVHHHVTTASEPAAMTMQPK
jgi:multidrug efflux pump